jgi:hypothetical protein
MNQLKETVLLAEEGFGHDRAVKTTLSLCVPHPSYVVMPVELSRQVVRGVKGDAALAPRLTMR